jgi:hypothetical protein
MRKAKEKWPVKELMATRQHSFLRGWLRYAKNLDRPKEMVQICEPETGRDLGEENKMGSAEDLRNCQEGREEIFNFQVGKGLISLRDLRDCHKESQGISHCQLGNGMRSLWDLEDYQEGSGSISYCQVGRDEHSRLSKSLRDLEVSSIQQGVLMKMGSVDLIICQEGSEQIPYCQVGRDEQMRLSEGLINSEMSLDQHEQLREEEDMRDLLMIGGIKVLLPFTQEEAEVCVADEATTIEEKSVVTVKEELEQTLEAAQADEEENEHSEECLNAFIQEAEEVVALKLTAEEAQENDEHYEEWLNIFSQETEKTATWEFVAEEEEADNISLADLYEKIEALERRVKVQGMHIQQVKLEADEEDMGDHSDLPMCQKNFAAEETA